MVHKDRLAVGVCTAASLYTKSDRGQGIEVQPIEVEMAAIPVSLTEPSYDRVWAPGDKSCGLVIKKLTDFAMSCMGAVQDKLLHPPLDQAQPSPATTDSDSTMTDPVGLPSAASTTTSCTSDGSLPTTTSRDDDHQQQEEVENGAKIVVDLVRDPDVHLIAFCPTLFYHHEMGLSAAAAMVGVMLGLPIRSEISFAGFVDFGGAVKSRRDGECVVSQERLLWLRKGRTKHLVMGKANVDCEETMKKITEWATTTDGDFQGLPSLEVMVIKEVTELVEEDNRKVIFGDPWEGYGALLQQSSIGDSHGPVAEEDAMEVESDSEEEMEPIVNTTLVSRLTERLKLGALRLFK